MTFWVVSVPWNPQHPCPLSSLSSCHYCCFLRILSAKAVNIVFSQPKQVPSGLKIECGVAERKWEGGAQPGKSRSLALQYNGLSTPP
jgi:hypothetical protein